MKRSYRMLGWLPVLATSLACDATDEPRSDRFRTSVPVPVLFDTDMDFDDAAALAYLCREHERGAIELVAVTVNNDGAGLPGSAIRHARCVLAACELDIPVADGSAVGVNAAPPELQGVVETILSGTFAECTASTAPGDVSAPELIVESLRSSPRPVTVLTTGPLTNLAAAVELAGVHSSRPLSSEVGRLVVMGGALTVPGNLFGTGVEGFDGTQELNIWIDPPAATTAFDTFERSGIELVPLDATAHVPVTADFVARLDAERTTPEAEVVYSIVTHPIAQYGISLGAFFWWDALAAVVATGHRDIVDFEHDQIRVVEDGAAAGRTEHMWHGTRVRVGVDADTEAFEDELLTGLD